MMLASLFGSVHPPMQLLFSTFSILIPLALSFESLQPISFWYCKNLYVLARRFEIDLKIGMGSDIKYFGIFMSIKMESHLFCWCARTL